MAGTSAGAKKGWAGRGKGKRPSNKALARRAAAIHASNIANAKGIGKGKVVSPKKYMLGG